MSWRSPGTSGIHLGPTPRFSIAAFDGDKLASRAFTQIFRKAQKQLRRVFGYEMAELRQNGVENASLAEQRRIANKEIADQRTQAASSSTDVKKRKSAGGEPEEPSNPPPKMSAGDAPARQWMVRSVLPAELRFNMAEGTTRLASTSADIDGAEALKGIRHGDSTGVMLDWRRADGQSGSIGLLFVVLGIVMVNGRECKDCA